MMWKSSVMAALVAAGAVAGVEAEAQIPPPSAARPPQLNSQPRMPYYPQQRPQGFPAQQPQARPAFAGQPIPNAPRQGSPYYPQSPSGGFQPNPAPYDPNQVIHQQQSGSMYWDPQRGWITNTQNHDILNSATSPGRDTIMPGTSVQQYNYWDGTRWVRGTRWLGQDGLWHGEHSDTVIDANGNSHENKQTYAPNPMAGAGSTGTPRAGTAPPRGLTTQPVPQPRGGYNVPSNGFARPR